MDEKIVIKTTEMIKEYLNLYNKYNNDINSKIALLYQVGKFYEIYSYKQNEILIGNTEEISKILDLKISYSKGDNIIFTGFPMNSNYKFINRLIDNDYTVIVFDQENGSGGNGVSFKRIFKAIYNKTLLPLNDEFNNNVNNYILVSIYSIKQVGITLFNNNTNELYIYECDYSDYDSKIDELKSKFQITEIIEKNIDTIDKQYTNYEWTNQLLLKIYDNIDFGLLCPIQFIFNTNSLKTVPLSLSSTSFLFNRIYDLNPQLLKGLKLPKLVDFNKGLKLHLNTIKQLNLNDLITYIDQTFSSIGKRKVKKNIFNPYGKNNKILLDYILNLSEEVWLSNERKILVDFLKNVSDLQKKFRQLSSFYFKKENLQNLVNDFEKIKNIVELIPNDSNIFKIIQIENDLINFSKLDFLNYLKCLIDFINKNYGNFGGSFVLKEDSDYFTNDLKESESQLSKYQENLDEIIQEFYKYESLLKTETNENEIYFKITNTRLKSNKKLLKYCSDTSIITNLKSYTKITCPKLSVEYKNIIDIKNELEKNYNKAFISFSTDLIQKIKNLSENICINLIEWLDISLMNLINKEKFNYSKPIFGTNEKIDFLGLRHPIIEKVNKETSYIQNDVYFSKEEKGILLYGINSSGKSALIRAIGICVVMAQSGLYVPCKLYNTKIYNNLMCQVDFQDNIFTGKSSYITEAIGLKYILKTLENESDSLVIADELTRGTENKSAIGIFGATLLELLERDCNFILTTHLHEIPKISFLKKYIENKALRIYHLKVEYNKEYEYFVFDRKLREGIIDELYGLEIVKSIMTEKKFFNNFTLNAELIRKEIEEKSLVLLKNKRSRYNSKKIINNCEICNYTPANNKDNKALPLDTHHIDFQCNANEKGWVENENITIHKNHLSNLVVLCKECHIKVHQNLITIDGYKNTTKGIILSYNII